MGDDIVLNLYTHVSQKNDSEFQKSSKLPRNRGQRIRARRALKQFHSPVVSQPYPTDTSGTPSENKQDVAKSNDDRYNKDKREDKRPQVSTQSKGDSARLRASMGKPVISSLFKNNPEIPQMKLSVADTVTETLFSSGSFGELPLHPYMVSNIEKLGFDTMTAVQQQSIPRLLQGRDLLVKSQTGSGKTMAYAIPIIQNIQSRLPRIQRGDGLVAVVVVPTRELATQSYEVFQKLLQPFMRIVPGCIMGGEKRKAEKARLRKGVNILVATPGRLLDHIENTASLALDRVTWLVLDEADRLLDMGYERDIAKIVEALDKQAANTSQRQTVLLSATLSEGVERLAGMSLKEPERVAISHDEDTKQEIKPTKPTPAQNQSKYAAASTVNQSVKSDNVKYKCEPEGYAIPKNLRQYFIITPCKLRLVTLMTFLLSKCKNGRTSEKIILFLSTQDSVEFHYRLLHYLTSDHQSASDVEGDSSEEEPSLCLCRLHGDMPQKDRTAAYQKFSATQSGVLLCTDVAARGLHLPSVDWVIQYSSPASHADYVHRVGRTARVGTVGKALLFLLPTEAEFVKTLNEEKISVEEMRMGEILTSILKIVPFLPGAEDTQRQLPRSPEEAATYLQMCCETHVLHGKHMADLAKKAYQSYVRAYATYPAALKSIFHIRNLHLGHVAKSFALREAPSNIGGLSGARQKTHAGKRKEKCTDEHRPTKKRKFHNISEFSSSLVFATKKKLSQKGMMQKKKIK